MRKYIIVTVAMVLLCTQTVFAAKGPGTVGDTAQDNQSTSVREYPGWNGGGSGGPIAGTYSNEDFDEDDDDVYPQGWRYSPSGWWYQYSDGGWPSNGWKYIDARWYFFNSDGHLLTGWFSQGDKRFYLNPVDDGTYGSMRTGWQIVDGRAYYFNTMSDGSRGAMLVNTTTPDGYKVGADGVMIP